MDQLDGDLLKRFGRKYVQREERREQFLQDSLAAWNEYQATGKHLTAEEADRWLAKPESGEDADAPECYD